MATAWDMIITKLRWAALTLLGEIRDSTFAITNANATFLERLLAAPNRTLDLLPGGQAHAETLTALAVGAGAGRQTITPWSCVTTAD